jgi:hypothetical protein
VAYLSPIDPQDSQPIALGATGASAPAEPGFTALEWSVIRLARVDRLWTIRPLGPVRRGWNRLIGRGNPQLANEKLEALRRISVLSWHFGFTVPGDDVAEFLSAGFTADQYELLVSSVSRWVRARPALHSKEVLA